MRAFLRKRRPMGATLIEVIISTGIFTLLMLTLFSVVRYGSNSWRYVEGRSRLQTMLRKIEVYLLDDLRAADYSQIAVCRGGVETTLADAMPTNWKPGDVSSLKVYRNTNSAPVGDTLWLMSAVTPDSLGNPHFARDNFGHPQWKKAILYRLATYNTQSHIDKFGYECKSGLCPHKWLVRQEFWNPAGGSSLQYSTISMLRYNNLSGFLNNTKYITLSDAFGALSKGSITYNSGVKLIVGSTQMLSDCIVAFRVILNVPEVIVTLKAFRNEEARDKITVNASSSDPNFKVADDLESFRESYKSKEENKDVEVSPYTVQYNVRVIPNN